MKRLLAFVFVLLFLGLLALTLSSMFARQMDKQTEAFFQEANNLIEALQTYRKSVGRFPAGGPAQILDVLSGGGEEGKKVLVMTKLEGRQDSQGQLLDPWGTPVQIFFAGNSILIRSAGPNRRFEDSTTLAGDDLFCSDAR
jgi:type II secretory pathway pseudopilin PulG